MSRWTRYLFGKDAYDRSLYDLVLSYDDENDLLDITAQIAGKYDTIENRRQSFRAAPDFRFSENSFQSGFMV